MWKANSRKQNKVCVLECIFSYMHSINNVSTYTQFCPWLISLHLKETIKLWMRQVCEAVNVVRSSPPVRYICVSESSQRWFNGNRLIGARPLSEPMLEYLQLDPWKNIQWNFNRNWYIFIQENAFENVVRKMAAILYRPQCGNSQHHAGTNNYIMKANFCEAVKAFIWWKKHCENVLFLITTSTTVYRKLIYHPLSNRNYKQH